MADMRILREKRKGIATVSMHISPACVASEQEIMQVYVRKTQD
jgi:hypothetical protein